MQNPLARKLVMVISCIAVFGIIFGFKFFSQAHSTPKSFSKAGLSILLTDDFIETDIINQTVCYQSKSTVVTVLKQEYTLLEDAGSSRNITLTQFAQMALDNNKKTAEILQTGDFVHFRYNSASNGKEYTLLAFVFRGSNAFWLVQFGCESKYYDKNKNQFFDWAKTITVS